MPLSPAFLDEVRARTDLVQLVGRTVKLTRAGRGQAKGCCPFHGEKTPSFYVYPDHYHCFGCGVHGDAIRWLTDKQGLPFRDAVAELAAAAGLDLPQETPEARAKAERAATLRDAVEAGQQWFGDRLWSAEGAAARAYLTRRGVAPELARAFGLGFAPEGRTALSTALAKIGADKLAEAGLTLTAERGGAPYDRFRGRLIFPIRDPRGRTIGFGGRALGDVQPKYLNSPDTPLFDKGRLLFNLDRAAAPARRAGRLFIVEGYMDVIALAGAGIDEAVAPMGTAMTEAQLGLAWRIVPEPILCLDGDRAGLTAAAKAARRALPGLAPGRSLRFVTLPEGKDPDDVVREGGAAAFEALATAPEPLHELLWRTALASADTASPEGRAALKAELAAMCAEIADRDVREQYDILFKMRFMEAFGWRKPGDAPPARASVSAARRRLRPLEAEGQAVLAGLLAYPDVAADHWEALSALPLVDARLLRVRGAIADAVIDSPTLTSVDLVARLTNAGLGVDLGFVLDAPARHFAFTSAVAGQAEGGADHARVQLGHMLDALAALGARIAEQSSHFQQMREAFADASDEERLQVRRVALCETTRQLESARTNEASALYEVALVVGPAPALGVRPRAPLTGDTNGEEYSHERGRGGDEDGRTRRAAY